MSAARLAKVGIKIPQRIERGPTDILKALASTVKFQPQEPDPSLQDDPYLLPTKRTNKIALSFARNSGRSTARFLLNKHPEIFYRNDAEPKVLAFLPDEIFNGKMRLKESDLIWCLDNKDVRNGIVTYNILKRRGIELADETIMRFFEMICFTNEKNLPTPLEAELESVTYRNVLLVDKTWNEGGLAHKIFNEIKEELDHARVYSAMIAGLAKFNEHAAAKQVFEDFKINHPHLGLYTIAYSSILQSLTNLCSSSEQFKSEMDEIVAHMEANLVAPNLLVFNSILNIYRAQRVNNELAQNALRIMNDMHSLNIKPSLSTVCSIVAILSRDRGANQHLGLFRNLLNYLSHDENLEIRDPRDINFFKECMFAFSIRMNNYELSQKLYRIYLKKPRLFRNVMDKNEFLEYYFRLMITTDSLTNTMQFYEANVPTQLRPSVQAYDSLADALDIYEADDDLIFKLGKDIIDYGLFDKLTNAEIFKKRPAVLDYLEKELAHKEEQKERRNRIPKRH